MLNTLHNYRIVAFLITALIAFSAQAFEEPLMPDEAFKVSAKADGADAIRVEWDIAKGYYLYRDKISFKSNSQGIDLGQADLPKGKLKHGIRPDGTEGEVETYANRISIRVPLARTDSSINTLNLVAYSQGCAEIGICYPPHTQKLSITLPAAKAGGDALSSLSSFSQSLGLGGQQDEVLPPEQAFQFSHEVIDGNTIALRWQIAPDHYLYKDKFNFKLDNVSGVRLDKVELSEAEKKFDPVFNKELEVYHNHAEATVHLTRSATETMSLPLQVVYQGCAEKIGICYPPQRQSLNINLPTGSASTAAVTAPADTDTSFVSEQDQSAQVLASGEIIEIIIYFFLGGLALAFTACMYPMIPILSSIIVGQGEKVTTAGAFTMSMVYVQSMAITFGIMGAVVALFAGTVNLQAYFQSPWVLIPFAILFVLLALSMFGFYNIQIPASLQGKLSELSNKQKGGSLIGVAIMGALSALIIGPCAGPVIIGALAVAAKEGDVVLGFLSMFVLGNGLGLPLLIVGTTGGKFLPRAGTWMDIVKAVAGVVLLAIALLFLERISFMPVKLIMLLWSALFIISAIYLGALEPLEKESTGWRKLWKGLGLVLLVYGLIVMLGGLTGARNFNDPLHGSSLTMGGGATATAAQHLNFKRIKSDQDLKREMAAAGAAGKYVMLDFYADWCTYCKQFEDYVFSNTQVQDKLKNMVLLQADVTANDEQDRALNKYTKVQAPPAILFFNPQGKELRQYRVVGNMNAEQFMARIDLVLQQK